MDKQADYYQRIFLICTSIILMPIALSYGFIREDTLRFLYGIELKVTDVNLKNIIRGLMGFIPVNGHFLGCWSI